MSVLLVVVSLVSTLAHPLKQKDIAKFYCHQNFTDSALSSFEKYYKSESVGGKYKVERVQWVNTEERYVRMVAQADGNGYVVKMYLRKSLDDYFKSKDNYQLPKAECQQLEAFNELVKFSNNKHIRLEKCAPDSNIEDSPADSYNFVILKQAAGKTLSQVCVEKYCKGEPLKKIMKYTLELLQLINMEAYFSVEHLNVDNIYFFKGLKEEYVTLTDLKYNKFPDYEKKKRLFQKDLHDLGLVVLQIITGQCDVHGYSLSNNPYGLSFSSSKRMYSFLPQDLTSPIAILLKVHQNPAYFQDDSDLGVQAGLYQMTPFMETMDEKNIYLQESIYHFAYKLFNGPNQFLSLQDAIDHPYLQPAQETRR